GDRLRAARDVAEGLSDQPAASEVFASVGYQREIASSRQPLLHPGREDRRRPSVGGHPGGGVDERSCHPGPSWLTGRMHVGVAEKLGVVRYYGQPEWRRMSFAAIGNDEVNRGINQGALIVKS